MRLFLVCSLLLLDIRSAQVLPKGYGPSGTGSRVAGRDAAMPTQTRSLIVTRGIAEEGVVVVHLQARLDSFTIMLKERWCTRGSPPSRSGRVDQRGPLGGTPPTPPPGRQS